MPQHERPGRESARHFASDLVQVGTLRHSPHSPDWEGEHETGPGLSLGFPQRAMEYQRDEHGWVVGSPNSIFLNNPHSRFRRRRIHPNGELTEWMRFDLAAAREVVARYAPEAADREVHILPIPLSRRGTRVFQVQRLLHAYLRSEAPPDALFVEETAFRVFDEVVVEALHATTTPPLGEVSDSRQHGAANGSTARDRAHRTIAMEAARFMAANYACDLDAARIARAAHVSRPTLFRAFRAYSGMTVHRYLASLRLREAYLRLGGSTYARGNPRPSPSRGPRADRASTNDLSGSRRRRRAPGADVRSAGSSFPPGPRATGALADLAAELGFASHAHLTSAFQREFGLAPSALRAEAADGRHRERIEAQLAASSLPFGE